MSELASYLDRHADRQLAELVAFASFPSVSADPAYDGDILACVDWLEHMHTPDEFNRLDVFRKAIRTCAGFFQRLGADVDAVVSSV